MTKVAQPSREEDRQCEQAEKRAQAKADKEEAERRARLIQVELPGFGIRHRATVDRESDRVGLGRLHCLAESCSQEGEAEHEDSTDVYRGAER